MQHVEPQPGQRAAAQQLGDVEDRQRRPALAPSSSAGAPSASSGSSSAPAVVADPRADDVGLPAGGDLLAQPLPGAVEPAGLLRRRDDGAGDAAAAAGQLAQRGDLQVAVDGHRHGARDRRGRHDQHVRRPVALGAQGVALLDAEAVLLVDDDQAEVGEVDALLQQGVGADRRCRRCRRRRRRAPRAGRRP